MYVRTGGTEDIDTRRMKMINTLKKMLRAVKNIHVIMIDIKTQYLQY